MTPQVLLDSIRRLIREQPPLEGGGTYGPEQHEWLGKACASIKAWNSSRAIGFGVEARAMAGNMNRRMNFGAVMTTLHEAAASIEQDLPLKAAGVFGPGAVYDFFVALNDLIGTASRDVLIVDPYLDNSIFDSYLSNLKPNVAARLLLTKYGGSVRAAAGAFQAQHATNKVELRQSVGIHDRIVVVDKKQCWVLGASIKDAAVKKPTYLAPLAPDVIAEKVAIYESLWNTAVAI